MIAIDHTLSNQLRLKWLLYDGHGNLVRMMAPDYTLSGFQWRGVWGEVQSSLGAGRGYCANLGHPEDETGLVYMRARYYEPATGRFISEDPARDGVNWYLYADGNPVNRVDVDGYMNIVDFLFALYQLGIPAMIVIGIHLSRKQAIIKQTRDIVDQLGSEAESRVLSNMGREAFNSAIDDLLKQYRYLQKLEQDALRLSAARGRLADVAIYYAFGEAVMILFEIAFGEWL